MGVFEDTVIKAKDAFDVAAKKTEEVWSIQKLRFNISSIKSQLSKEYETLGRVYYDSIKNNCDDDTETMEHIINEIDDKKVQISELEKEIACQKRMIICCSCKTKNLSHAIYCCKCGSKIQ